MIALLMALTLAFGGSQSAHVYVTDTAPFTVHGIGFKAGERVTLTLSSGSTLTRTVVASARGVFTRQVTLFKVKDAGCPAYTVVARGARGSVAVVKRVPMCANIQPVDG